MAYLEGDHVPPSGAKDCFFCAIGSGTASVPGLDPPDNGTPESTGVVWRGRAVFALLNAFPYANGHVMVAPYEHQADLVALSDEVASEIMAGVRIVLAALGQTYHPEGFNVGINLGAAAGAGFADHLHVHVVPRWAGDTNFMTTIGGSRVIPEDLKRTALRVRRAVLQVTEAAEPG